MDREKKTLQGRMAWAAVLLPWVAACGGADFDDREPVAPHVVLSSIPVFAEPPGHQFEEPTRVALEVPEQPGAEIFYTLDGSPATGPDALPYEGPIHIDRTTVLNFIAMTPRSVWSEPGTELYVARRAPVIASSDPRALRADPELMFFAWQPGQARPMRDSVRITATGSEPVSIESISLGVSPHGAMFADPSAFRLLEGAHPVVLAPGQVHELVVGYQPTETLRSAAIVLRTSEGREVLVDLWGRVSNW